MFGSSSRTCLSCSLFPAAGVTASTTCDIILVLVLLQATTVKPMVLVGGARASKASPTASNRRLLQGRFMSKWGFCPLLEGVAQSIVFRPVFSASTARESTSSRGSSRGRKSTAHTCACSAQSEAKSTSWPGRAGALGLPDFGDFVGARSPPSQTLFLFGTGGRAGST